ncbi:hypothetical protein [Enterococcus sp. LJL90]
MIYKWQVKESKLMIQMGDTLSEIAIESEILLKVKGCSLQTPIYFEKNKLENYYFSDPVCMNLTGAVKEYSSVGDVSYFPNSQCIGIALADEELTLGVPRIKIGRIKGSLLKLQTLATYEEAIVYWDVKFIKQL